MIVRQALPREHRDSGERALKKLAAKGRRVFPLPFQALRASFPEGKPSRETFETYTMKMVRQSALISTWHIVCFQILHLFEALADRPDDSKEPSPACVQCN